VTETDLAPATLKPELAMDGPCWTEEVEDLVDAGAIDGAITLLESVVLASLPPPLPRPPTSASPRRSVTSRACMPPAATPSEPTSSAPVHRSSVPSHGPWDWDPRVHLPLLVILVALVLRGSEPFTLGHFSTA
jgi:hypothetical protein